MKPDRIIAIVFMLIAGLFYYQSLPYPSESTIYVKFILILFFFLSAILFIWPQNKSRSIKEVFSRQKLIALLIAIGYIIVIANHWVFYNLYCIFSTIYVDI